MFKDCLDTPIKNHTCLFNFFCYFQLFSFSLINDYEPDAIGKIKHYVGEDFFGLDKGSDRFYDEKEKDNDNCNNQALVFFYHTTLANQSYRKDNTAFQCLSIYRHR